MNDISLDAFITDDGNLEIKNIDFIKDELDHLVVYACASSLYMREVIKKEYETDRILYFESFKKSRLKNRKSLFKSSIEKEVAVIQSIGVVSYLFEQNDREKLHRILKKGFKNVFKYVQERKKPNFLEFYQMYSKEIQKNKGSQDTTICHMFVYVCLFYKKEYQMPQDLLYSVVATIPNIFDAEEMQDVVASNENEIKEFWEKLGFEFPRRTMNLTDAVLLNKEKGHEYVLTNAAFEGTSLSYYLEIYDLIGDFSIRELLGETFLTKEEIKLCIHSIWIEYSDKIPKEVVEDRYVAALFVTAFKKHFNNAKEYATIHSVDEFHYKIKKIENDFKLKFEKSKHEVEKITRDNKVKQNKLDLALSEIQQLKSELKVEKENNLAQISSKKELEAYRKYFQQLESTIENQISIESMLEKLKKIRITFVGGHQKWQDKLSKILPYSYFIHVDDLNKDFKSIQQSEYVVLNVYYISHGFIYKFMKEMESVDAPLIYAPDHENIDITVTYIYQAIFG